VFFVLEVPNRSGHLLGTITNPEGRWTTQQIRDLVLDLGERATQFRFLVRDRAGQFTASFDALLADVASRWSGSLLGARERTASPNGSCAQSEPNSPTACWSSVGEHLRTVLTEYVRHYNGRRPHRARNLRPPRPTHPAANLNHKHITRRPVLGGLINEYERVP
jgi:putative transposase